MDDDSPDHLTISDTRSWSRSEIKIFQCQFDWIIENFAQLSITTTPSQRIESCAYRAGTFNERTFVLRMYPIGKPESSRKHVSLYIGLRPSKFGTESSYTRIHVSMVNSNEDEIQCKSLEGMFNEGSLRGWSHFVRRDELLHGEKRLLDDGRLIVRCNVALSYGDSIRNIFGRNANLTRNNKFENQYVVDLGALLECKKSSDLNILVEGESVAVHRAILAARSSTFASMLEHEMEEPHVLEVKGCSKEMMDSVLRFIYTGSPASLNLDCMDEMLNMADRFALPRLKLICEDFMISRTAFNNATELLIIAHKHSCDKLKKFLLDFIKQNCHYVRNTNGWNQLLSSNPNLLDEIVKHLMTRISQDHFTHK